MCRWCKGAVSGRRRTFCSDACVHEWRLRSSPTYLRECVFERDGGVCALCGLDTHRLRRRVMRLPFAQRMREIRALQQRGMVHRRRKSWWEADHIRAVVEGGDSSLDNMRTLCIPCHREVTRGLRARRLQKSVPPVRAIEEPDHAQNPIDLRFAGSDAAGDRMQHESGDRQA